MVGPVVRIAKRAVRRGLRWYIGPIMEQQSRVNQQLLDVLERLRLENERLACEVEVMANALEQGAGRTAPSRADQG